MPGLDRAAIHHEGRTVEPPHRDQTARHVFVAARDCDQAVVPLGMHHRLDRVGDDVAGGERVAHPLGAHRNAVADADRVEPHAHHAGGHDPVADLGRERVEVHVAGVALVPHGGDAHLRLVEIGRLQAGAEQHGLGGALRAGLGDPRAVTIEHGAGHGGRSVGKGLRRMSRG